MRVTSSIIAWLIPSILVWGGCATPALWQTSPAAHDESSSPERSTDSDADESEKPSRIVCAEAALIRETALTKGFSPVEAAHFEQAILNAPPQDRSFLLALSYARLNESPKDKPTTGPSPRRASVDDLPPSLDMAHRVPSSLGDSDQMGDNQMETGDNQMDDDETGNAHLPNRSLTGQAEPGRAPIQQPPLDSLATSSAAVRSVPSVGLAAINTHATAPERQSLGPVSSHVTPAELTAVSSAAAGSPTTSVPGTRGGIPTEPSDETAAGPSDLSWQRQLRQAIVRLQQDLDSQALDGVDTARLRACLSLLQLAVDDPEKAMSTLEGMDDQQLEFWRQTVLGLGILLDPEELPKLRQRVDVAAEHLQKGISTLSTLGPLRLVNLTFCTSVLGYGNFVECDAYALQPEREVLLYVEVENFTVAETEAGNNDVESRWSSRRGLSAAARYPIYETELQGRYDILDQNQHVVVSRTLPPNRDKSRNHRRDYFIPYSLQLPKNIAPGPYTLELTLEDKIGNKFGNAVIDFRIR